MEQPRYFVDKRFGCVAVRDSLQTNKNEPGLHADTEGVVQYWDGIPVEQTCETCGHKSRDGWMVPLGLVTEAETLCKMLNAGNED